MLVRVLVLSATVVIGLAQQAVPSSDQLSARELYFREKSADTDTLPKLNKVVDKASDPKVPDAATVSTKPPVKHPPAAAPNVPVVEHLGLRYRLLLVDKNTNAAKAVDPDGVFHKGDCLAIELEPNRTGYLYVLARESSGNWNPLFPNAAMESETEIVRSRTTQRAPEKFCFELDENVGTEHLYIILSRNPSQVQDLNMAILKTTDAANGTAMADASVLNKEANDTVTELGSRGFKVTKTGSGAPAREKYSVYVVPTALEKKDSVFAEIKIKHQ